MNSLSFMYDYIEYKNGMNFNVQLPYDGIEQYFATVWVYP